MSQRAMFHTKRVVRIAVSKPGPKKMIMKRENRRPPCDYQVSTLSIYFRLAILHFSQPHK